MADQYTASAVHVTEIIGAPGAGKTWNLFLNHVTRAKEADPATVLLIFSDTGDVPARFAPPGTGHMFRVAMDTIESEALAALPSGAEATSLAEVVAEPGQDWLESMVSLPALEAGDALILTGVGHRASTACTVFSAVATRLPKGTRFHLCLDDIASRVPFGDDHTFDAGLEGALNSWRSLSRSHVYGFDVSRTAQELDATSEFLKSWPSKTDPQATYEVMVGYHQDRKVAATVSAFMCGVSRYTEVLTTLANVEFVRPGVGVVRVDVGGDGPVEVVMAAQEYLEQIRLVPKMVWVAADTVSR